MKAPLKAKLPVELRRGHTRHTNKCFFPLRFFFFLFIIFLLPRGFNTKKCQWHIRLKWRESYVHTKKGNTLSFWECDTQQVQAVWTSPATVRPKVEWSGGCCAPLRQQGREVTHEKTNTWRSRPFFSWRRGEFVVTRVPCVQKQCRCLKAEFTETRAASWSLWWCWFIAGSCNTTWFSSLCALRLTTCGHDPSIQSRIFEDICYYMEIVKSELPFLRALPSYLSTHTPPTLHLSDSGRHNQVLLDLGVD